MNSFDEIFWKRVAVIFAMLLFVIAIGYTCIFSLSKSITIELNERLSSYDNAKVSTISNVNMNKTLEQVLEENDFPVSEGYVYGTDLNTKVREVDILTINRKVNGTLKADNEVVSFDTGALTVGDLLKEQDIHMAPSDYVEPSADTPLSSDTSDIVIYRQTQQREKREESIAFETVQTEDPNLPSGTVEIDIPGIEGRKIVTEDVKYRDGMAIARNLVDEEILLSPMNQIERIGTGKSNSSSSSSGSSSNSSNNKSSNAIASNNALSGNNSQTVNTLPNNTGSGSTEQPRSSSGEGGYYGTNLSQEDFDLVCAIVEHEAGTSYESALAVMTCVMNRVEADGYGDDPVSVLTAPGQFASYFNGYYRQFLGNSSTVVKNAVRDCLNGTRIHDYLNYRSYQTTGSEKIGGNWYFND